MDKMIQKANHTRSRSKEKLFDKLYLKNGENFKNLEEDDKQLILMTHTFENILESKQKNNNGGPDVKVIQNNNKDVLVQIPILNLGKIVESAKGILYHAT